MLQAIDSETLLIMPGGLAPPPVCFSYTTEGSVGLEVADKSYDLLDRAFTEHHTTWANAPFDLGVIGQRWPTFIPKIFQALDDGRIHDVQSREKLMDIAKGCFRFKEDEDTGEAYPIKYGLDDIARRRGVGHKVHDKWQLRYHLLDGTPLTDWPKEAKTYACVDALITLRVHESQEEEVAGREDLKITLEREAEAVRAHWALHLITAWGFPTNPGAVEDLYNRCVAEREALLGALQEAGLVREDGTRDTVRAKSRVIEAYTHAERDGVSVFDRLDKVPITATGIERMKGIGKDGERLPAPMALKQAVFEEGFISTSRDTCVESGDDVLASYARYSQLANLLGKDVPQLRAGTIIPVQARYQPIMETFRTSSTGFNIQNLRREPGVRECFRARPGHVLVACDFDTAELVSLAQVTYTLFGASDMRDIINSGRDIHLKVAGELTHKPYEECERLRADDDEEVDMARQLAKALDFGIPGGMGAERFTGYAAGYLRKYGHTLTVADARHLKTQWLGWFREMPEYFAWIRSHRDKDGWYWVQHPITKRWRGKMFYTAACNNGFQELTAFGAKAATYEVAKAQHCNANSPLYGTKSLAFVHDELILEMPEDRYLTQRCNELERVMCKAYNFYTPDVPVSAEAKAMRVWSKNSKRLVDGAGNIGVWSPKKRTA